MNTLHLPGFAASLRRTGFPVLASLALLPSAVFAATFYVSPSGSDSNSGTQSAPFRSISKAQSVAASGDTVTLRGGTYSSFTIMGSDSTYHYVHQLSKSGITYTNYPGETPVFNFSSIPTDLRVAGFHVTGSGIKIIGFHVTGTPVGSQKQSECYRIDGSGASCAFTNCVCHDNSANGFYFTNHSSGSCTNCDSYNNIGPTSASVGNTDGFGAHGDGVTFYGCRSWHNSDDGYDCIASYGANTFDHCWAYNMTAGGDSNGFKVGGWGSTTPPSSVPVHTVKFCLSADNNANGFYANHQPGQSANWTNNTAYNNRASNYNMLERVSTTDATDIAGYREVFHYNIAYVGTTIVNDNNSSTNKTNNSWTKSGVTVSSADFQSTDATQITTARNSDGSLPTIAFMRLVNGSDLVGMGCFQAATTPITYQAENAAAAGGVTFDSNNAGFNGTGFANFPTSGGTLTFNSVDGNGGGAKSLAIRYANGTTASRTGTITVNGVTSNITFNPTGAWTTWATMNVNVTLNNGTTNTIQLASTGQDYGNIDEITVP